MIEDRVFAACAREGAGLAVAGVFALLALTWHAVGATSVAVFALVVALLLAAGSTRHLVALARVRRAFRPPGRLVDVGGHRMHVVADGPRDDGPTIVWIAGGHAGGYALHHLHVAIAGESRSILVDRFGTGWSDTGPFPRTTAREADEVMRALDVAGERGPFVFAGHSFGGLLAANIARRNPRRTHALVLIDPTPLDVVAYGPRLGGLTAMRRDALLAGVLALFGIDLRDRLRRRMRENPAYARVLDRVEAVLGEAGRVHRAVEGATAGAWFASASIFRELAPRGLADRAWETVVFDGELGALPVYLVAPQDSGEVASLPEIRAVGDADAARMVHFFAACRERYLATSTRAVRVVAPKDSGHNFPYFVPDVVIDVIRRAVREQILPGRGAAAQR